MDIIYHARSSEELNELEGAMKGLSESYSFKCTGSIVVSLGLGGIDLKPSNGTIEDICKRGEEPKGKLFRITKEYTIINLEDRKYLIRFDP